MNIMLKVAFSSKTTKGVISLHGTLFHNIIGYCCQSIVGNVVNKTVNCFS